MLLLILIGSFLSMMTLLLSIHQFMTVDERASVERLDRVVGKMKITGEENDTKGIRGLFRRVGETFGPAKWDPDLEQRLQQASLSIKGAEFVAICLCLSLLGFAAGYLGSRGNWIVALAGAYLFFWIPFVIIRIRTRRRQKAFNAQLGEALILIANSLRTGYSFLQSMDLVAREMPAPISVEFARTMKEMNLGMTTEDALEKMEKRVRSDDLDLALTAVLIQRQVGGNLAELLDTLARTIRARVTIRGKIQTLTAQGRISGVIVSVLPVCLGLILYFIHPEYIRLLFTHAIGPKLLLAAVVSQIIGILVIRRIVNIKI